MTKQVALRIVTILAFLLWMVSLFGMAGGLMSVNQPGAGAYLAGWGVVFVATTFALLKMVVGANKVFAKLLAETNSRHGLNFKMEPGLWFGWNGTAIFFDPANKKALLYLKGGSQIEVRDFGSIMSWVTSWNETPGYSAQQFSNIRIQFKTNSPSQPLFEVFCFSKAQADEWDHRLNLLLRG